jgi:hypothetical protein
MRGHTPPRATLGAAVAVAIACGAAGAAHAAPDLRKGSDAGPLRVYPDDRNGWRFYYPPGDLVFAASADGKPDLLFVQMAYSGTAVSGDQRAVLHRNVLSFGVEMQGPSPADVRAARAALPRGADLRPLPIRKLEAALVYATAGAPQETQLPEGHFQSSEEEDAPATSFWSERSYSLGLDNASAELFWDAMHTGQGVISIAYAFLADGIPPDRALDELEGTPKLVASLEKQIAEKDGEKAAEGVLVKAGATALQVDAARWPDLFKRVEFSGNVPPGYAILDVRCYDFSDGTRPDLFERRLEIDAEGVSGSRVRLVTTFGDSEPDLYARTLRFPFAVRLDRPYRYRVTELRRDGEEAEGEWRQAASWSRLLDITSKVASLADYQKSLEEEDDETN